MRASTKLNRNERIKLNILSLRAYGVSGKWQKMYSRGCLVPDGYLFGMGKGGWRSGAQKTLVRRWTTARFSIGVIRKIMLNRIRMLNVSGEDKINE